MNEPPSDFLSEGLLVLAGHQLARSRVMLGLADAETTSPADYQLFQIGRAKRRSRSAGVRSRGSEAHGEDMNKEIRGMLIGLCIVILAVAAYVLKEKPVNAPDGTRAATTASENK
jgi:hypothetical protein